MLSVGIEGSKESFVYRQATGPFQPADFRVRPSVHRGPEIYI